MRLARVLSGLLVAAADGVGTVSRPIPAGGQYPPGANTRRTVSPGGAAIHRPIPAEQRRRLSE